MTTAFRYGEEHFMATAHRSDARLTYEVLGRWRERCLEGGGSLFTDGATVWTASHFDALHGAFNERPDESKDPFLTKLQRQLADQPDEIVQLFAELLYVHLLIARDIGGRAKRENLAPLADLVDTSWTLEDDLDAALDQGLVNTGVAYKTYRPAQLWFFIDAMRAFFGRDDGERQRLLEDPWAFKDFLDQIPLESAYAQYNALLHMVHPNTFEDCVSRTHKQQIRDGFADLADAEDVDRALLEIRQRLEADRGGPINFYSPEYRRRWDPAARRNWDQLAAVAPTILEWDDLADVELDYKNEYAELARLHLSDDVTADGIDAAMRELAKTNLVDFRVRDSFQKWAREHPEEAVTAVHQLLEGGPVANRIDAFHETAHDAVPTRGAVLSLASAILLAIDPTSWPIYRSTHVERLHDLFDRERPRGVSDGTHYAEFVELIDEAVDELHAREIEVPNRLIAQSLLWTLLNGEPDDRPLADLDAETLRAFIAWRGDSPGGPETPLALVDEQTRRATRLAHFVRTFDDADRAPFLADEAQAEASHRLVTEALDELDRTRDLRAFAKRLRRSHHSHAHTKVGAHVTYLSSLAGRAPDPGEAARLAHEAFRLRDGGPDLTAVQALEDYAASIGTANAPSAGMTLLVASAIWSLQDSSWPPYYASSERCLETLGWLNGADSYWERYQELVRALGLGRADPMWAAEATSAVWNGWFAGLDPTLVERCQENAELIRGNTVDDELRSQSERNVTAVLGECKLLGRALKPSIEEVLGQELSIATPTGSASQRGLHRADGFISWRPGGSGTPANLRVWITANGVAIGVHPGASKDRFARASEIATRHAPEDLELIAAHFGTDTPRRLEPGPVEETDREFLIGRWIPGDEALGTVDLADEIRALAYRLRPVLGAWFAEFGDATIVTADVTDDDLSSAVEAFLRDRAYPLAKDKQALEDRAEFAATLTSDALAELDVTAFRKVANTHRYGFAGPQSTLNTTLNGMSADELQHLGDTVAYLLWGEGDVADRIDALLDEDRMKIRGLGEAVILKLLSVVRHDRFLPVFPLHGEMGKTAFLEILGLPASDPSLSVGQQHVIANDRLRERLEPFFPGDPHGMREFLYWYRSWDQEDVVDEVDLLDEAAEDLHVSRAFLDEIVDLLRDKGQVIFYGPPGTGKTYLAKRLARALVGNDEHRMRLVQFHPSYTYEDFFEGYRPKVDDSGNLTYELQKGPLARTAELAETAPAAEHVMVIDEINRANMAKVFGELLFLLEYRDEPTTTQYRPDSPFTLPRKLFFIGTMNTADRSIALIDAALRRRFHFVPFFPHEGEIAGLLRRWLEDRGDDTWVADLVDFVNADLRDDLQGAHLQIGPSHFMVRDLDEARLRRIWRYSIHPYIEEQLFGQDDRVARYRFDEVMVRFRSTTESTDDEAPGLEGPADE